MAKLFDRAGKNHDSNPHLLILGHLNCFSPKATCFLKWKALSMIIHMTYDYLAELMQANLYDVASEDYLKF